MAKPVFRLGVSIDKSTWNALLKTEEFKGIETFDFIIDNTQPSIWLCFVADDHGIVHRVHDVTTKNGGLPMKWAGEWRESAELFNAYFRAAVAVEKAEQRMRGTEQTQAVSSSTGLEAAKKDLDETKARFEATLRRDARVKGKDVLRLGAGHG